MNHTVLTIYYNHFGIENNRIRKHYYAHNLLKKKIYNDEIFIFKEQIPERFNRDYLQRLSDFFLPRELHYGFYLSFHKLNRYYRNHIYPAEIYDYGSIYYKANIDFIDSILIDRNPDKDEHCRIRGKYFFKDVLNFIPIKKY